MIEVALFARCSNCSGGIQHFLGTNSNNDRVENSPEGGELARLRRGRCSTHLLFSPMSNRTDEPDDSIVEYLLSRVERVYQRRMDSCQ